MTMGTEGKITQEEWIEWLKGEYKKGLDITPIYLDLNEQETVMNDKVGRMSEWKKVYPVCGNCGSSEVLFDAYVSWDKDEQKYIVVNVLGQPTICESETCEGGETDVIWKEVAG